MWNWAAPGGIASNAFRTLRHHAISVACGLLANAPSGHDFSRPSGIFGVGNARQRLDEAGTGSGNARRAGGDGKRLRQHQGSPRVSDRSGADEFDPAGHRQPPFGRAFAGQPTFKSEFGQQTWYYMSIDTKQRPFKRPQAGEQNGAEGELRREGECLPASSVRGMEKVARLDPDGHRPRRWAARAASSRICSATSARSARSGRAAARAVAACRAVGVRTEASPRASMLEPQFVRPISAA